MRTGRDLQSECLAVFAPRIIASVEIDFLESIWGEGDLAGLDIMFQPQAVAIPRGETRSSDKPKVATIAVDQNKPAWQRIFAGEFNHRPAFGRRRAGWQAGRILIPRAKREIAFAEDIF